MRNHDRLAAIQVGSHDGHWYLQILELARLKYTLDKIAEPVIAGEAQSRNAPPRDVSQSQRPAGRHNPSQRSAARIRRAQNAAHARSRDTRYWYVVLLEHPQHPEVRESPRKSAA